MDFVIGFPRTLRQHDSVWVIVDRMTKSAHFFPVHTSYSAKDYAKLYIRELVRLYSVPLSIISYRDGQAERTIQTLEDMLRACAIDFKDERKDQKTLERFRAERQAKIDELKEKTNHYISSLSNVGMRCMYFIVQSFMQRYDPDPASRAAAASVLASKLGANTGLKVYLGDESKLNGPFGKSNDVEIVQSTGLRNRKQARFGSADSAVLDHSTGEMLHAVQLEGSSMNQHQQIIVEHYNPKGSSTQDGGWLGQIAALLVGEDPTQYYALICGSCHKHNGLARKEEFVHASWHTPQTRQAFYRQQFWTELLTTKGSHLRTLDAGNERGQYKKYRMPDSST
ncbi:putative vacuolar protein sorting-associated protein 45 -like protein [Capsicum annuum]|nr:putative vacuolar protein sorting-associated protein 45 -like protein [Capsicum annuum]KAF3648769.1 putative vacuolar protein sorting-associated protein 45 -like protein [Capsicum annuum]